MMSKLLIAHCSLQLCNYACVNPLTPRAHSCDKQNLQVLTRVKCCSMPFPLNELIKYLFLPYLSLSHLLLLFLSFISLSWPPSFSFSHFLSFTSLFPSIPFSFLVFLHVPSSSLPPHLTVLTHLFYHKPCGIGPYPGYDGLPGDGV